MILPSPSTRISIAGVPVRINRGWLIVATLLVAVSIVTLATSETDRPSPGWYFSAVVVVAGAIASLVIHELAHIVVARRIGERLSALLPSHFGALADDAYAPHSPRSEVWVAIAGPLASLLLTFAFALGWYAVDDGPASSGVGILALINLTIAVANLMPGFPLDGGRIFRAFVWYLTDDLVSGTKAAVAYGQAITVVTTIVALFLVAIGGSASVWGAWLLLATWTIGRSAREGYTRTVWRKRTASLTLADVGLSTSRRIDGSLTIDDALDDLLEGGHDRPLLVMENSEPVGIVSLAQIRQIPRASWTETRLRQIVAPVESAYTLSHDAPVHDLLSIFDADPDALVTVEQDGRPVSVISRNIALSRIQTRVSRSQPSRKHHKP